MASAEQIKDLVASFAKRDDEHFRALAMNIAASAAKSELASAIQELVDRSRRTVLPAGAVKAVPIARPDGELSALVTASYPRVHLSDMVLAADLRARLERVLTENRQADQLRAQGLDARRKLLLIGPPGCGKSMTAQALAGEARLPLLVIQFHTLITRYMGETAAKLHTVFQSMQKIRGVYLSDEFDALGTSRLAGNDVGEARRIVNSFLQLLEGDESASIIVAATNHVEPDGDQWVVGKQARSRGSLHSDWWRGPAQELAQRDSLAVFPVTGWWRERKHLNRVESVAPYAVLLSITSPAVDIDLYNAIVTETEIATPIEL